MAINREWHPSPNYSSRGGSGVRLITVHTSEGATTNANLANFITQASAQVSYHVSVDNVSGDNKCYEYVSRGNKSWAQANYNPVAVTGCFCTPSGASSGWSRADWFNMRDIAITCMAKWVAEEAKHYGIPLVALSDAQAQGSGRGVCQHRNLGPGGSNHSDCGAGFPMDELIKRAKGGGTVTPPPDLTPILRRQQSEDTMGTIDTNPMTMPIPPGAKKFIVAADVSGQGAASIPVRVAMHIGGTGSVGWKITNVTLTPEACSSWVPTEGHNTVSATVSGPAKAGFCFEF